MSLNHWNKKKIMYKNILMIIGIIAVLIVMSLGFRSCRKSINYSIHYKSHVEETIRDMVKPEYLK